MTILEAIHEEVANLSSKVRFEYATLEESNAEIFDRLLAGEFPVCLVLPFEIVDESREGGQVRSSAEINTLFLDRIEGDMNNRVYDVEINVIAPMRNLTRELVNLLDKNDIIDQAGIESLTHRSLHEPIMDSHLYGNQGVFTIKFSEGLSTC